MSAQAETVDTPAPSRLHGIAADVFNPVLVKEIRQAQRGKVFRVAFIVTLIAALVASMVMVFAMESGEMEIAGSPFFLSVFTFLAASALIVVPFQAFVAMGSEWEDNTFEMLVLSNLRPAQIMLGKVLAAMVQAGVFFATFTPFVAVAFLLRGIDVAMIALILGLTFFGSICLTVGAVTLSTLVRARFARVVLMAALVGGLTMCVGAAASIAGAWLRRPDLIADSMFVIGLIEFLLAASFVTLIVFFVGSNQLAHPEENRSTNLRVLISIAIVVGLGVMSFNFLSPSVSGFGRDSISVLSIMGIFFLAFTVVGFGLEPERLGRRVAPNLPSGALRRLVITPWLPGGGRGLVYFFVHLALILAVACSLATYDHVQNAMPGGSSLLVDLMGDGGLAVFAGACYALVWTLLPMGLLQGFRRTHRQTMGVRGVVLLTPLILILLPNLFGVMLESRSLMNGEHAGNPGLLMDGGWDGHTQYPGILFLLVVTATASFLLNLPRIVAGLTEVALPGGAAKAAGSDSGGADSGSGGAQTNA